MRRVAQLVVDYSATRRLVVDNSASRRLIVDYSVRHDFVLRPRWLYFSHTVRRDYFARQHWLYFEYAARRHDVVFWSHHVDHSSRLVFQTSRERQSRPQQLVGIKSD
jgi:hypothetical protein